MLPNPQETLDLVTFTEKILNGKIHFLCSVRNGIQFAVFVLHRKETWALKNSLELNYLSVRFSLMTVFILKFSKLELA